MRLWSIHPRYLDTKGMVALWREALLARHVLAGKTKGYTKHPQLQRFRSMADPINSINCYINEIYNESLRRGFSFNPDKTEAAGEQNTIDVTDEQLRYEFRHLLAKLEARSPVLFDEISRVEKVDPHPLFSVISGDIEPWEKTS